jgi:hypothetical protein
MSTNIYKRTPWNKGQTKETHPSVAKISNTMKKLGIDNFRHWRNKMMLLGKIKSFYALFRKNGDLAELIGAILGDGHIEIFPRTERLTISSNSNNQGFVKRYSLLIQKVIGKTPTVKKQKTNCIKIYLYEKYLSKRLGIPAGDRSNIDWNIPGWIWKKRNYLIRYLRGLYEAEGSFSIHKPTYTYKIFFTNSNRSLLNSTYQGLLKIGLMSAHLEKSRVTVSRKIDVFGLKDLLSFRSY